MRRRLSGRKQSSADGGDARRDGTVQSGKSNALGR